MSQRNSKKLGFLALALLLAGMVAPVVGAAGALEIVDCRVNGSMVAVTVANNTSVALNAVVTVTVEVADGTLLQAAAAVKVQADGSAVAMVGFGQAVNNIIIFGLTEDSNPT